MKRRKQKSAAKKNNFNLHDVEVYSPNDLGEGGWQNVAQQHRNVEIQYICGESI
jgi:hypothetical protein